MLNGNDLELLSAYIDGALTDGERADLEARLLTDADLRRELARLRATVDLVKTLPTLAAPRDFTLTRQTARRPRTHFVTSATFSALSTAAAVILLIVGVALSGLRSQNEPPTNSAVLATQAQVAAAPTDTLQPGLFAVTEQAFAREEMGDAAPPETVAPLDTDGSIVPAPPVANMAQPSEAQSDDTRDAQGVDSFMQYATGTLPPLTGTPLTDVLRFADVPTETLDELNTQADGDEEAETQTSQADTAGAGAALSQQESAAAPPPSSAAGGAAAEAPLLQGTMLAAQVPSSTPKPTNTETLTPSPAPTTAPPPTMTPSPAPSNTLMPTDTPAQKATTQPTVTPPAQPVERAPETVSLSAVLIAIALVLFGVAVVTTIVRRRG